MLLQAEAGAAAVIRAAISAKVNGFMALSALNRLSESRHAGFEIGAMEIPAWLIKPWPERQNENQPYPGA
jgi:hypothetical protein